MLNVCPAEKCTKCSSNILLCLVCFSSGQTLRKRSKPKAEFAEVDTFFTNRYPSLRIFFTKKIWKSKKLGHFYYSSYKSCILGILEANFFSKKVSYSANSA